MLYQLSCDLEVVSKYPELDQLLLYLLHSSSLGLGFLHLIQDFLFFLHDWLPNQLDLLGYLVNMQIIDILYDHFLNSFQMRVHNNTDFFSGEEIILSLDQ